MVQMVPLNITKESIPIDQKWDQQVLFMHTNTLKYYPDEVRFGSRAFELFQHTPYLRADDAYLTIFYIDGRFCIEFAEYQSNGIEYKAVMSNFTTILPDFKQEYQLLINQAEHLY